MKDYNGFSGKERDKVAVIIRKAIQSGELPAPNKCCMCGQEKGMLHYHLEDYSKPLEDLQPICVGCHMRLHIRFDYPNLWKRHLHDLRQGKTSPAYYSVYAFFASMKKNGITKDIDFVEGIENPQSWFERLSLVPINLNQA